MNSVRSHVVFQFVVALLALVLVGKGVVHSLATTLAKPISEQKAEETLADVVIWMDGVFALADLQPFEESGEDTESEGEELSDWEDAMYVSTAHFGTAHELVLLNRVLRISDCFGYPGVSEICTPPPERS
jgi:hypothetical protein